MPIRSFLLVLFLALFQACAPEKGSFTLLSFNLDGRNDVLLNETLVFRFSAEIDPLSIDSAGLTIADGSGEPARGRWSASGRNLVFAPSLPTQCDFQDSGLRPGCTYTVLMKGHPRHCALLSTEGRRLDGRLDLSFRTMAHAAGGTHDSLLKDETPQEGPSLLAINGCAIEDFPIPGLPVSISEGLVLEFSDPLHPATVLQSMACLHLHKVDGNEAPQNGTIPLRCSFAANSGNRSVLARPAETPEDGVKYDLRFETLDFKDFAGNGIKNEFSYFRLIFKGS